MTDTLKLKLKKLAVNLTVTAVTCLIGLLLCEWGLRMVMNPADFLSVRVVSDKILGGVPASRPAGFDSWGFRNKEVPRQADIVAVGDSHTYGNTAKREEAWPQVLQELSGRTVYNLGMGGYGPNQYTHLFKTKALELKPKAVICGLYMGDDFENAYLITYGLDYWARLRQLPAAPVDHNIWRTAPVVSWHKRIRVWLSEHSVLYQIVVHGPILGRFQGDLQIQNAGKLYSAAVTLDLPEKKIREAFLPAGIAARLNQDDVRIREGMRITFELLNEMQSQCASNRIQLLVAVIPTKEMVFAEYLENNPTIPLSLLINKLLADERKAREATFQFLSKANIRAVDTLPALRGAVSEELYAHTAADMHPGRNGYRVIAQAVAAEVKKLDLQ